MAFNPFKQKQVQVVENTVKQMSEAVKTQPKPAPVPFKQSPPPSESSSSSSKPSSSSSSSSKPSSSSGSSSYTPPKEVSSTPEVFKSENVKQIESVLQKVTVKQVADKDAKLGDKVIVEDIITKKPIAKTIEEKYLTWQEYHQERDMNRKKVGEQVEQLKVEKEKFDLESKLFPNRMYTVTQGDKSYVLPVKTISKEYDKMIGEGEKIYGQAQKAYIQSINLDKRTKITKTSDGYSFKMPDTRLDWSKKEIKKIEQAPPVIKELAMFGFTATSSIASLGKPVSKYLLESPLTATYFMGKVIHPEPFTKKDYEKLSNTHFLSPYDIAFEPMGWSPKGSTKLIEKTGPAGWAGMAASEALQSYAMTQFLKPVTAGVKVGTKGLVSRVPSAYAKFTSKFPEEKLITGIGRKVGKTTFANNLSKWTKGYVRGKELIFRSAGSPVEKGGLIFQKGKYVVNRTLKNPFGKKIWISPSDIAKYNAKLAGGKTLEIGFPVSRTIAGVGDVIGIADITTFKRGLFGVTKTYGFNRASKKIGAQVGKLFDDEPFKGIGSFIRGKGNVNIVTDIRKVNKPNLWFETVKESYKSGYPYRFTTTESGKQIVDFTTGFGKGISPPTPKSWINKIKTSFIRSTDATSILIRKPLQKFKFPYNKFGGIGSSSSLKIPGRTIGPGVISPFISGVTKFSPGVDVVTKTGNIQDVGNINVSVFESSVISNVRQKPDIISDQIIGDFTSGVSKTDTTYDVIQKIDTKQDVKTSQVLKVDTRTKQTLKLGVKSVSPITPSLRFKTSSKIPVKPLMYNLSYSKKHGGFGYGNGLYSKYRFRKFNIPKLGGVRL